MNNIAAHAEDCPALLGRAERATVRWGRTLRWGPRIARTRSDEGRVVRLRGRRGRRRDRSGQAPRQARDQQFVADVLEREFGIQKQAQKARAEAVHQRIHSYCDADGAEAYQALRMYPKSFRLRQPDGKGGYLHNIKGITPLPYNLPEIILRPTEPVFIVEGEQCADVLIEAGLVAG